MNGLLFITHETEKYSYVDSVNIALEGGCRRIQLRMKQAPVNEIESTAWKVKEICESYHAELYIDDHVEICKNIKATGVHLGKLDMSPLKARMILGKDYIVGGTANTYEDIQRLAEQGVDYIGLGPFRYTTTKQNLSPVLGISGYIDIIGKCKQNHIFLPVLAIGGITIKDIPELMKTGVSGIALSSTILNADNPVDETKRIMDLLEAGGSQLIGF